MWNLIFSSKSFLLLPVSDQVSIFCVQAYLTTSCRPSCPSRLHYKMHTDERCCRLSRRMRPAFMDRMEAWTTYAQSKHLISQLQPHDLFYICRKEAEAHYEFVLACVICHVFQSRDSSNIVIGRGSVNRSLISDIVKKG